MMVELTSLKFGSIYLAVIVHATADSKKSFAEAVANASMEEHFLLLEEFLLLLEDHLLMLDLGRNKGPASFVVSGLVTLLIKAFSDTFLLLFCTAAITFSSSC